MSTVLVHNSSWRREQEARDAWPSAASVRGEHWWNLWKVRQAPYGLLANGTRILLLDSWPGGGVLSWLVHARDVRVADFPDKDAAVFSISRWTGDRAMVLGNQYTVDRPAEAGKTIYWRAAPVVRLDVPKPPALAVGRNGWLVTDDADLARWGVELTGREQGTTGKSERGSGKGRGQGRRLDVETKRAIEARAMTVAKAWCRRHGWADVRDVSATNSWDLEALDAAGSTRYIEVKGTTGDASAVEVTKGEVDAARRNGDDHAMVVVRGIHLDGSGTKPIASGGLVGAHDPWRPQMAELTGQRFTWAPAPLRVAGT